MAKKKKDQELENLPMLGDEDIEEEDCGCGLERRESTLGLVGSLAKQLNDLNSEIEDLEAKLASKKKDKTWIEDNELPNALNDLGMKSFTLNDGTVMERRTDYYPSIKKDNPYAALRWLNDHGHGSIIKTNVTLNFSKEQGEKAKKFIKWIESKKDDPIKYSASQGVHPMTLKSVINDLIESKELKEKDYKVFNIFQRNYVKISSPKKKK